MYLLLAQMKQDIRGGNTHRQPVHGEDGGVGHGVELALPQVGVPDVGRGLRVYRVLVNVPLGWY